MNENMRKRNEILAQTVIKGLESRNMSGYYAADKEEAVKKALELRVQYKYFLEWVVWFGWNIV